MYDRMGGITIKELPMFKVIISTILLITLFGCGSTSTGNEAITNVDFESLIKEINTTDVSIEQVKQKLGNPTTVTTNSNGLTVFSYFTMSTSVDAATFIPVVGLFAGGAESKSIVVTVSFNDKGVAEEITISDSKSRFDF